MLSVGLFGLGTVGKSLVEIIRRNPQKVDLKKVVDRSYERKKEILQEIPASKEFEFILEDEEIDVVVELIGGIEDALYIAREAIDRGKVLITANKALLAEHGYALFYKAFEKKVAIGFEAAVAGAIPIIRLVREFYKEEILEIEAILNGTSNYILSKMYNEGISFEEALKEAKEKGIAEEDPTLDIEGIDSAHKLTLLASFLKKKWFSFERIPVEGIKKVSLVDILWAKRMGYKIKLLARYIDLGGSSFLNVEPILIPRGHLLFDIEEENNAIYIRTSFSGEHLLVGKGAGGYPTAHSVFSDILYYGNLRGRSYLEKWEWKYGDFYPVEEMQEAFYLRVVVVDKPGVLAQIAQILGRASISIASVYQEAPVEEESQEVDLVILLHPTKRGALKRAIEEISTLEVLLKEPVYFPIKT